MHKTRVGIRKEDKNTWERRAPLSPNDVHYLSTEEGLSFFVQSSTNRVFKDEEYTGAGAEVVEDLSGCGLVFAIKEIPISVLKENVTYVFFSHTIKGQSHNMPMLKRIMDLGATLIDYEKVVDEHGKRFIFFGEYAGLAGMVDTLWAFGQRLKWEGIGSPFAALRQAFRYDSLDLAAEDISNVGEHIETKGLDPILAPLVIGVTGYGNVSRGAQRLLTYLPVTEIDPSEIATIFKSPDRSRKTIYLAVFREEHTVRPALGRGKFNLKDYYDHPEKYRSQFQKYVPYLSILVNCIYWDKRYPRLITRKELRELYETEKNPRLRVIGDISCDIDGAIEFTVKATDPERPVFVYDPLSGIISDGVEGRGPVVMAIDNLPCELPRESSNNFSHVLKRFVPSIAFADFSRNFEDLELPPEIKRALIVYKGSLTSGYAYLEEHLKNHERIPK
ncbi:MAG: hypothetical protein HYU64_07565 [Armatimonadetes bacterium]|nr:hypothetical protein [Armatimonadota bacterium]